MKSLKNLTKKSEGKTKQRKTKKKFTQKLIRQFLIEKFGKENKSKLKHNESSAEDRWQRIDDFVEIKNKKGERR